VMCVEHFKWEMSCYVQLSTASTQGKRKAITRLVCLICIKAAAENVIFECLIRGLYYCLLMCWSAGVGEMMREAEWSGVGWSSIHQVGLIDW